VYERLSDGPYWLRSPAGRPGVAICSERFAVTPAVTVGKIRPSLDPNTSAAARACVYDNRVAGLFLSAASTTSASEYWRVVVPWPNGAAAVAPGTVFTVSRRAASVTLGDGCQSVLGLAGVGATPSMRGGECTHAVTSPTSVSPRRFTVSSSFLSVAPSRLVWLAVLSPASSWPRPTRA
jgi:hypothetical protein